MKTLFLLIALYTISGKQAVPSGDLPEGATCAYEQSGSRSGQMTAGNDIQLVISGFDSMILKSVTLTMKSNKESGAGELTMTVGNTVVWSIPDAAFTHSQWAGRYTTDWVSVTHDLDNMVVHADAPIVLHISASQNSLYLQSVALDYLAPQGTMHTVSFKTYSSVVVSPQTEQMPNAGVILPTVVPEHDALWAFVGWAAAPVSETADAPVLYRAGNLFFPTSDCTMHAVYKLAGEQEPWLPTSELDNGDYMIALCEPSVNTLWYAQGAVDNGLLATAQLTYTTNADGVPVLPHRAANSLALYTLTFCHDTLTITHKATNTSVLLSGNGKFAKTSSQDNTWTISPAEQTENENVPLSIITGLLKGVTYYFSYTTNDYGVYFCPTSIATYPHNLLLFALRDMVETPALYSSYAFGTALKPIDADNLPEYKMQLGTYVLTIKNGKKYLQINQ